jgi:hypothetical protein
MNGSGKDRISGLLSSRFVELLLLSLGTPTAVPYKAEAIEEEKQMRPVVEFTSLELQITDEQGKHSNSVKQDGV